jgi:hypothetical protein
MRDPLEHTRYGVVVAVLVSASSLACGSGEGTASEPRAAGDALDARGGPAAGSRCCRRRETRPQDAPEVKAGVMAR